MQPARLCLAEAGGSADGDGDMRFKFQVFPLKTGSSTSFPAKDGIFDKFQAPPGFTLLEVMIAVAIIAIAFMAVLGSQSQGLSLSGESRFNRTAALLAQGKIAEIEAVKDQGDLNSDSGDFGDEFPGYTWQLSVNEVLFDGAENISNRLKQIDLEVFWGADELYQYRLRLYRFFP